MNHNISFLSNFKRLDSIIAENKNLKLFVLADSNTALKCLSFISALKQAKVYVIPAGEMAKNLRTCENLWDFMQVNAADRNSILINLGGGVITDLGGFAASLYQRGIAFIHIPTSLLAMVDAAIGGKTGVDFIHLKNYIGNFTPANQILICPEFLATLPKEEWINGWAESIKHALIADRLLLDTIKTQLISNPQNISLELLQRICKIKMDIVAVDPKEKNIRKALNFGHTIGHALESFFLIKNQPIPHGLAVAAGMLMESEISMLVNSDFDELDSITDVMNFFPRITFNIDDCNTIAQLTLKDKKNSQGIINITTLNAIGQFRINSQVDLKMVNQVLENYCKHGR